MKHKCLIADHSLPTLAVNTALLDDRKTPRRQKNMIEKVIAKGDT